MAIAKWLMGDSLNQLTVVAKTLGAYRRSLDAENFQSTLLGLGMNIDEIVDCFNAIDARCFDARHYAGATVDTKFSVACGILLCNDKLPRNFLLYRLVQLMNPELLSVSITVIPHKASITPGRWEHAGKGLKRVLMIRLPTVSRVRKTPKPLRPRQVFSERWVDRW